jgi:hypothetical protein
VDIEKLQDLLKMDAVEAYAGRIAKEASANIVKDVVVRTYSYGAADAERSVELQVKMLLREGVLAFMSTWTGQLEDRVVRLEQAAAEKRATEATVSGVHP